MNRSSKDPIDSRLAAELRRAEGPYRRALATFEKSLSGETVDAQDVLTCLARIEPMLNEVRALEGTLAPVRQEWLSLSRTPGAELRQALQEHARLLGGLIERVDELERQLQEQRAQLAPQVDRFVLHQQMQKAYQQPVR